MAKIVKRVVLGIGHPWYIWEAGGYTKLQLTQKPVATSILLRGGERLVEFKVGSTGNYNKVRLVLEILK